MNTEIGERSPIAQQHVGVHQRRFHQIGERIFLLLGKFGTKIWNHAVYRQARMQFFPWTLYSFSTTHVGDLHAPSQRPAGWLCRRANYRAIQPDANCRIGGDPACCSPPSAVTTSSMVWPGIVPGNKGPHQQPGDRGVFRRGNEKNIRPLSFSLSPIPRPAKPG